MAVRAAREALHQDFVDKYWEELKALNERPEVQEAQRVIFKALSEQFSPEHAAAGVRRKARRTVRSKSSKRNRAIPRR